MISAVVNDVTASEKVIDTADVSPAFNAVSVIENEDTDGAVAS